MQDKRDILCSMWSPSGGSFWMVDKTIRITLTLRLQQSLGGINTDYSLLRIPHTGSITINLVKPLKNWHCNVILNPKWGSFDASVT